MVAPMMAVVAKCAMTGVVSGLMVVMKAMGESVAYEVVEIVKARCPQFPPLSPEWMETTAFAYRRHDIADGLIVGRSFDGWYVQVRKAFGKLFN
jgi:hypothetical protein